MTTTDDWLRDIAAESASTHKLDSGIPLGDKHMGAGGSVEEPTEDSLQNDILVDQRTARRTDVASERNSLAPSYAACEIDFRDHHHTNAAQRWGPYEIYRVVYRYGYDLGADPRYRTAEWASVEQEARPRWEERNPGTWDEFKDTIRYAWDTAQK